MRMSHQDMLDGKIGFFGSLKQIRHVPGGIDHSSLASLGAADEVNKIHHWPDFHLLQNQPVRLHLCILGDKCTLNNCRPWPAFVSQSLNCKRSLACLIEFGTLYLDGVF